MQHQKDSGRKDNEVILAEMHQRRSKHGNIYYFGKNENGSKYILHWRRDTKEKKEGSDGFWELVFSK